MGDGKKDIVDVVQKKIQRKNKNTHSKPLIKILMNLFFYIYII